MLHTLRERGGVGGCSPSSSRMVIDPYDVHATRFPLDPCNLQFSGVCCTCWCWALVGIGVIHASVGLEMSVLVIHAGVWLKMSGVGL